MNLRSRALPFLLAAPFSTAAHADVLTVGDGGDFAEVTDAVAASTDGDTILIGSGTYASVVLDGRSLTLIEDQGAAATLRGLEIRNVPSGGSVEVIGLRVAGPTAEETVRVEASLHVYLERLVIPDGRLHIDHARVTIVDSRVEVSGYDPSFDSGLTVVDATVFAYHSTFEGMPGFAAARIAGGYLYAFGCVFRGNDGLPGTVFGGSLCDPGPNGADGLRSEPTFEELHPSITVRDCLITPGGAAPDNGDECEDGGPGLETAFSGGTSYETLPGGTGQYSTTTPVRNGDVATLTFQGSPGDVAFLAFSFAQNAFYHPQYSGSIHPALPTNLLPIGAVPGSGVLQVDVVIDIPGIGSSLRLYEQGVFVGAGATISLGTPAVGVVLGASS